MTLLEMQGEIEDQDIRNFRRTLDTEQQKIFDSFKLETKQALALFDKMSPAQLEFITSLPVTIHMVGLHDLKGALAKYHMLKQLLN